jgi:hypothetical protein
VRGSRCLPGRPSSTADRVIISGSRRVSCGPGKWGSKRGVSVTLCVCLLDESSMVFWRPAVARRGVCLLVCRFGACGLCSFGQSARIRDRGESSSVVHPPRLETRAKESNMCASRREHSKPGGVVKAKVPLAGTERRSGRRLLISSASAKTAGGRSTGASSGRAVFRRGLFRSHATLPECGTGRTLSAHVGTRKMVIYAWPGRSRGKLGGGPQRF